MMIPNENRSAERRQCDEVNNDLISQTHLQPKN